MNHHTFRALITRLIPAVIVAFLAACSHHWREGRADVSDAELEDILNESLTGVPSGDSGQGIALANELLEADSRHTDIYWNEGPRPNHTLKFVFRARSLNFLLPPEALANGPITGARILFFTSTTTKRAAFIVGLKIAPLAAPESNEYIYYSFAGTYRIEGEKYVAEFVGKNGRSFTLNSIDVEGDHLAGKVKLIARDYGGGDALASFPTLHGIENE